MPLLPRKNSLDFNPDATILASKKLSAITLENLKNPLQDPDQSTLSTLQAQKSLGDSFDRLEEMAGNYHSLVLRLGSVLGKQQTKIRDNIDRQRGRGRKLKGGALTPEELDAMFGDNRSTSTGSTGSTVSPSVFLRNPSFYLNRDGSSSSNLSNYLRRVQSDRQRFSGFYNDDERNSTATPASSVYSGMPDYPYDFSGEIDIDDEDASTLTTARSFAPIMDLGGDGGDGGDGFIGEQVGANFNSLTFPIIQLVRRMNILINSRIKPAISALSQSQATRLTEIYQMVRNSYNDVVFPDTRRARTNADPFTKTKLPVTRPDPRALSTYGLPEYSFGSKDDIYFTGRRASDLEEAIIDQNQFGDEILSVWNKERQNLLLNLTTIINSWRQNTPSGQQTEFSEDVNRSFQDTATRLGKKAELVKAQGSPPYEGFNYQDVAGLESVGAGRKPRGRPRKTGAMTLIGNGRNFYGDQINHSRDLPTIFSGALRNCPTKYLL
jgi:hypothetical protein